MAFSSTPGGLRSRLQIRRVQRCVSLVFLLAALGTCSCGEDSSDTEASDSPPSLQLGDGTGTIVVEDEVDTSMFALSVPDKPEATPEPTPTPTPTPTPVSSQGTKSTNYDPGLGLEGGATLSGSQIKTAITRNMGQIKACYERELKKNDRLAGKLMVSFTIGADGKVRRATIGSNSTGNRTLGICILTRVRKWGFPTAESPTDVVYPFTFKPRDF